MVDSDNCTEPIFSPDTLNLHYSSVQCLDSDLPHPVVEKITSNTFNFSTITIEDLYKSVKHFKSRSVGPDGISLNVLLLCLPVLAPTLTALFNKSITTKVFPTNWKDSFILPINKVKNPSEPSDYRPISLLSILSKVFEKIVSWQIISYLTANNLFDPFQSGFLPHHSTETTLTKLTDDIRSGINDELITLLVLFDFSKAFDRVSHKLLLNKMHSFGFSLATIEWFESYLTNRRQSVICGKQKSKWLPVKSGVPQGSVLGPLLFLIFIDDIRYSIGHSFRLLYADDLQIYLQVSPHFISDGLNLLEIDISNILDWSIKNNLITNFFKTQAIAFGRKKEINIFYQSPPTLKIGDHIITFCKTVKNLGVMFDYQLTFEDQLNKITRATNYTLYRLRYFRRYVTPQLRKRLFTALVFPHLNYSTALGDVTVTHHARIQKIINSGV